MVLIVLKLLYIAQTLLSGQIRYQQRILVITKTRAIRTRVKAVAETVVAATEAMTETKAEALKARVVVPVVKTPMAKTPAGIKISLASPILETRAIKVEAGRSSRKVGDSGKDPQDILVSQLKTQIEDVVVIKWAIIQT
jgi:hypothetical protein